LGLAGAGPLLELATLTEYAAPLKPTVVLWLYFEGNDLRNLYSELKSPLLMNYLDPDFSQNLIHRQLQIDKALDRHIDPKLKNLKAVPTPWPDQGYTVQCLENWKSILKLFYLRQMVQSTRPSTSRPIYSESDSSTTI
jgi:hypothetical protein